MVFLFVFAHPDDETVACAGTIKQLSQAGHHVELLLATEGGAGEVAKQSQPLLKELGSVKALRRQELSVVQQHLGLADIKYLEYEDGEITNQDVWGGLLLSIIDHIDAVQPDFVVTFDHSGWYFHLDHVGVSIATTLALHQAKHRPKGLLLSHFQPDPKKWRYVFLDHHPITHQVEVADKQHKLAATKLHASQNLKNPQRYINKKQPHYELYQLVFPQKTARRALTNTGVFSPVGK